MAMVNLMLISCSNVIHIHKANYGRTDKTTCSSGRPANQLSNTNCYAATTLPIIRNRCEGRTTCLLKASNSIFSDPCFGTYKYLDISYSCVPPSKEPEHPITTILHYTPNTFSLICSNVIRIHTASYGRRDKTTCSSGRPASQLRKTDCSASTTLPIVRERCEGRTTCLLKASNSIFSDPCFGTYKYLDISYSCVPPSKEPEHPITTILHYTPNTCDGKERCTVMASSNIFPDRCPGTYKNLDISYSCITEIMQ
ncbi:L-rhamnose-binding lectin CSL3-like [Clupea harengus]|uniref:L-rhamnose-binding lectin CSL3-like n=1 Tax=Clupea harengus TaxID=7950 RepID=A0A8M1KCT3_CLUHA|nr:L-rhamnose-binding lectin CSL3-like [Clupea harengus]